MWEYNRELQEWITIVFTIILVLICYFLLHPHIFRMVCIYAAVIIACSTVIFTGIWILRSNERKEEATSFEEFCKQIDFYAKKLDSIKELEQNARPFITLMENIKPKSAEFENVAAILGHPETDTIPEIDTEIDNFKRIIHKLKSDTNYKKNEGTLNKKYIELFSYANENSKDKIK